MFDKFHERIMNHAIKKMKVDTNPDLEGKPRKFLYWFAFKFTPFVKNVAIYIMLYYILDGVLKAKGFETMIMICFMIIIFEISGLKREDPPKQEESSKPESPKLEQH